MIWTAPDVESLSRSLSRWEWGEYISEAFVIIACAGELFADLGTSWLTEERKKHLQRRSTILLVAALSVSLICLARTNELSGSVIGSLGDKAEDAGKKAGRALADSGTAQRKADEASTVAGDALIKAGKAAQSLGKAEDEANQARAAASNALLLARSARQEADSFEKDIASAKEAATKAEAKLADRTLTDKQVISVGTKLEAFRGQAYTVTAYWDSKESLGIANRIHLALKNVAGWSYSDEGSKGMMLGGEIGILVWTHPDAGEATKKAATSLTDALNAEGIETAQRLQNPKNPKTDMININVGAKR